MAEGNGNGRLRQTAHVAVSVATPSLGLMRIEVAEIMVAAQYPMGMERHQYAIVGLTTSDGRNRALAEACRLGSEFLFFWDDDIVPRDRAAPTRLLHAMMDNPEMAALGGVYPRRTMPEDDPIVIAEPDGPVSWDWQDGKLHRVYMTGTGFTVFRVAALAALGLPEYEVDGTTVPRLFWQGDRANLTGMTDDYYAAEILWKAGLPWYVHGQVQCIQVGKEGEPYVIRERELVGAS